MPGVILAILPALEFMIRAGGVRTVLKGIRTELSPLHCGNGRNLLQKTRFIGLIHIVTMLLGTSKEKQAQKTQFEEFCLTPSRTNPGRKILFPRGPDPPSPAFTFRAGATAIRRWSGDFGFICRLTPAERLKK